MCDGWGKSWAIGLLAVVKAFGELAWCCRSEEHASSRRLSNVRKMEQVGVGMEDGCPKVAEVPVNCGQYRRHVGWYSDVAKYGGERQRPRRRKKWHQDEGGCQWGGGRRTWIRRLGDDGGWEGKQFKLLVNRQGGGE